VSSNKRKACITRLGRAKRTHRHREHLFSRTVALEEHPREAADAVISL
jgi:hypothetical protein